MLKKLSDIDWNMVRTSKYVDFDISLLPVGHEPIRTVYGFDTKTSQARPLSFRGSIGEISGLGKPYGELFSEGTLTLGENAALWNLYLAEKRGLVKLPKAKKEYLDNIFGRGGYGNILETV